MFQFRHEVHLLLSQSHGFPCGHLLRRPFHGRCAEFPHPRERQIRPLTLVDVVSLFHPGRPRIPHVRRERQNQPLMSSGCTHTRSLFVEASLTGEAACQSEGPGCWSRHSQLTFDAGVSPFAAEDRELDSVAQDFQQLQYGIQEPGCDETELAACVLGVAAAFDHRQDFDRSWRARLH
jgi:hypothetical protein